MGVPHRWVARSLRRDPQVGHTKRKDEQVEPGTQGRVFDEIQRQMEDDLQNAERVLSNAAERRLSGSRGRGSGPQSRTGSVRDPSRHGSLPLAGPHSRHASPRGTSPEMAEPLRSGSQAGRPEDMQGDDGLKEGEECIPEGAMEEGAQDPDGQMPYTGSPGRSKTTSPRRSLRSSEAVRDSRLGKGPSSGSQYAQASRGVLAGEGYDPNTSPVGSRPASRTSNRIRSPDNYDRSKAAGCGPRSPGGSRGGGGSRMAGLGGNCPENKAPSAVTFAKNLCSPTNGNRGGGRSPRNVSPCPNTTLSTPVGGRSNEPSPGHTSGGSCYSQTSPWELPKGYTFRAPELLFSSSGGEDERYNEESRALYELSGISGLTGTSESWLSTMSVLEGDEYDIGEEIDFKALCDPAYRAQIGLSPTLPKKPKLTKKQLELLIQGESKDVDHARTLYSSDKKGYKKPCPKQEKAQMDVRHMIHSKSQQPCEKEYSALVDPDPEDISIETAADLMLSQERGVSLEGCPVGAIQYLFKDDQDPQRGSKMGSFSVVDKSLREQDDMIQKSASVPSEGVSDSVYARQMKEKRDNTGARKSSEFDFTLGQKREVLLVAQRPQRFNKIQFRGNLPRWFPGYLSAFPDQPAGMKVVSSPSRLLEKAWAVTNPTNIPSSDLIILE